MATTETRRTDGHTTSAAPPPVQDSRPVGAVVIGLGLVAVGVLWLLAALGIDVPVAVLTPVALVVMGIAVLLNARRAEDDALIGLVIFVGVWLAIAAVVTATIDVPLTGAVGDRSFTPATAADLDDDYRLFAGTATLDLRGVVLTEGATDVSLSTVLGQLEVILPPDMTVQIDATVAGGAIDLFGESVEGIGLSEQDRSASWEDATRRLDLELRVGLGEIRVVDR